ncbi:hypothetical protein U1Q18_009604 [Sarracenia purpurea var. burkii]
MNNKTSQTGPKVISDYKEMSLQFDSFAFGGTFAKISSWTHRQLGYTTAIAGATVIGPPTQSIQVGTSVFLPFLHLQALRLP